jgi:ribosomal protein S18 acetylase RimI-like enzyme
MNAHQPAIVNLQPEHAPQAATLHCATLEGLLTVLGPSTAQLFYAGAATSRCAFGFVAIDAGVVVGVVLGSIQPSHLKSEVVKKHPCKTALTLGMSMLRRPIALWWLVQAALRPETDAYDCSAPELTYLAVSPTHQGKGLGRELIKTFNLALRNAGIARYELSVDDDNPSAIAFYERLGFVRIGTYHEFGRYHFRYEQDLRTAEEQESNTEVSR